MKGGPTLRRSSTISAGFIFLLASILTAGAADPVRPVEKDGIQTGGVSGRAEPVGRDAVLAAAKKATRFMMESVSNRGGFLWVYTSDLSDQWGEIPARKSQAWVQAPGTASMGNLMLKAFRATGDPDYLKYAEKIAGALVYGQHPEGGWHYFIDFDPQGIPEYYKSVASRCWGWEEYYHYDGNCTFDDDVHGGATRFLMALYLATLDPRYRVPLDRALEFVLASQFPNGAWPQRYPLRDDYSSDYTFNDGVISGNIDLLLEAYEKLGDPRFQEAARRGMDFVALAQLPLPQAGWALQYGRDMKPAKARNYEPAAVTPSQTAECIGDLERFYEITGERDFLRGIPAAIRWLEGSVLNGGKGMVYKGKTYTHATFYEPGSNRPIYAHRKAALAELDPGDPGQGYWVDYEPGNFVEHYGALQNIDLEGLRHEFERLSALTPEAARADYEADKDRRARPRDAGAGEAGKIISAMDGRGAWVEDALIKYYPDFRDTAKGRPIRAIKVQTFERNLSRLLASLN
jgi:PelA/Pel-15E family pectate lyase